MESQIRTQNHGVFRTLQLVSAQQLERDCQIEEVNQKLYLLWQESADYSKEEDTLVYYTGVLGFLGAVLSLVLLWYSAECYDAVIGGLGQAMIALSFCSLVVAFIINFMTASQSSVFTKKCNDIREQARKNLGQQNSPPGKPS